MDQLQQCPVCTLYLHNGMSLESHLDTHPKDQVIRALCKISVSRSNYGSRCTTPAQSERSYCSRSRTPASALDGRATPKTPFTEDKERRKRPPRTPAPRCDTPTETFRSDAHLYDGSTNSTIVSAQNDCFINKLAPPTYVRPGPTSELTGHYVYVQEQPEEVELKYSRSEEYNLGPHRTENLYAYSIQSNAQNARHRAPQTPNRQRMDCYDILPKGNNVALLKTNVAPVQYVNQNVKPLQFMVPATQGFVQSQQNSTNNMIISGNVNEPMLQPVTSKSVVSPMFANQLNHMSSAAFTPGTTVVTQNSQFFYREMVHNIDGKPYLSAMPTVVREDMAGTSQNPVFQNVMVVNPYPNGPCMYPQQQIMASTSGVTNYEQSVNYSTDKRSKNVAKHPGEIGQTLVIEVGPIGSDSAPTVENELDPVGQESSSSQIASTEMEDRRNEFVSEMAKTKKGLKILSNIKVEVPIQHHKSMLHEIVDLTGAAEETEVKIAAPCLNANETILPDIEESKSQMHSDVKMPLMSSENESNVINTFSVIKNIGNPSLFRETTPKSSYSDTKIDVDQNDSCSIPDLTCKEKASISPCSELSGEYADHTSDRSCSPDVQQPKEEVTKMEEPIRAFRNNSLKLNNLYVKKNKKVLQIKNSRPSTTPNDQGPSGSTDTGECIGNKTNFTLPANLVETFKQNNVHCTPAKSEVTDTSKGETDALAQQNQMDSFDADTEEQSMDIEPIAHSDSYKADFVHVPKVEAHQSGFANESEEKEFVQLETMRPVNVIAYGNMANNTYHCEASNKESFDGASLTKDRFVSMMSDNYFGDNIIGDYFTPDRAESFSNIREERQPPIYCGEVQKTELQPMEEDQPYMWGEGSQREPFMLPHFIHESYKVTDYNAASGEGSYALNAELEGGEYHELTCRTEGPEYEGVGKMELVSEERSSSEEVALDICADERMPPRGELSGQESNGDMDAPWSGMYHNINSSTSYDLMARETWVSDGSEVDTTEKADNLESELERKMKIQIPKRCYKCATCGLVFDCPKERRVHRAKEHPMPSTATSKTQKIAQRRKNAGLSIKKEEKLLEGPVKSEALQMTGPVTSRIVEVFDISAESKPKLETDVVIKEEPRKRRRDYVCPVCKVDFANELAFHSHLKLHPLECLTCGKYFYRRANLQLHLRIHLAIKNYKCEVCEKRFSTKQKLMEHINIHTGAAPVKCSHCSETFRRHSNMIQHRNRHHFHIKKKIKDYVCHCGEVLHSRRKLLWHKETHSDKPKACTYCSDKFVHAASLTRHIRRAHNRYYVPDEARAKENVQCPVCKQVYLKNNIDMHIQTHSGKKPFSCVICNKSFSTKWNLKLHRWTHANRSAKPFKCTLCKGAFIRHSEYTSHMNSHKSVRPYTCNYCGCQFIRKYNCQRHVKEHESNKKYVCTVAECGKSFHRSYYLTEHMRVHSGARPFSCNICGKTSSNKSNHNKHVKIHHAREPVATEG